MLPGVSQMKAMAGEETFTEGQKLFEHGGVREDLVEPLELRYIVNDGMPYLVRLSRRREKYCTCEACTADHPCRHVIAAALKAQQSGFLGELQHQIALQAGPELFETMDHLLPGSGDLLLEVTLIMENSRNPMKPTARIQLRVGEDRMYVVRNIPQLVHAWEKGESLDFGKGLVYQPSWMRFGTMETKVLGILSGMILAQQACGFEYKGNDARIMPVTNAVVRELFSCLTRLPFVLILNGNTHTQIRVRKTRLPMHFRLAGTIRGLTLTAFFPKDLRLMTEGGEYVFAGGNVLEVEEDQQRAVCNLLNYCENGKARYEYPPRDTARVVDELVPFLKRIGVVEIDDDLNRFLERRPLRAQVYLDRAGRNIQARIRFLYGDREIDPFHPVEFSPVFERGQKLLLRDAEAEHRILDTLGAYGFRLSQGMAYLSGMEVVYRFVSEGVRLLETLSEVYLSKEFKKLTPRRATLKAHLSVSQGFLNLRFEGDPQVNEEIQGIMEALAKHRDYFRFRDGSFLDLSEMENWQPVAENIYDAQTQEGLEAGEAGQIRLQAYRTLFLTDLMHEMGVDMEEDPGLTGMLEQIRSEGRSNYAVPCNVVLRPYQKRGFEWLCNLDSLHMGGILADDMGLGKTVQMICAIACSTGKGEISLIVAPTSLTYNWLHEWNRFVPEMDVQMVSGNTLQRKAWWREIGGEVCDHPRVIITSYPLIRRDIDVMKGIHFRSVILDEAQQIKNPGSTGAIAVKQLQARSRFALTGTPVENHRGELWSLFDFILPGYLSQLTNFMRRYDDGNRLQELQQKIRPFLMRRLKDDVLPDLPDKMESVRMAQMTAEQEKVYRAARIRAYERMNRILQNQGLGRGRMDVLSVITELRQICCHPALILDDYQDSSGKLDLLMDILPEALEQGRRVLLFSQFTSMLRILRQNFENAGIQALYLDGHTPAQERIEMAEAFNAGAGQVLLISLKAGGTGLNLTGADMVIHYDPWWNPAVEDQATDRAHRIGQTRKVQVIRLVTHDTIEEQVVALSQSKKQLFEQLIQAGEENITSLSDEAIRAIFSDMEESASL